ncbi:hypothetical protein BKA70DRAFT_1568101 [Coprinopsis sp. MPI-PUGE-AT-0042]|nr:hypothetical protein BKA70DRAFT_1568101 [Coprinopsis sp. MPI-PUGE-AT-0042]
MHRQYPNTSDQAPDIAPSVETVDFFFGLEPLTASLTRTFPLEHLSDLKRLRSLIIDASSDGQWSLKVSSVQHLLLCLPHLHHISLTVNHIEHDCASPVDEDGILAPLESFELITQTGQLDFSRSVPSHSSPSFCSPSTH